MAKKKIIEPGIVTGVEYSLFKSAIGQIFYILPPNSDYFTLFQKSKLFLVEGPMLKIMKEHKKLNNEYSILINIKE